MIAREDVPGDKRLVAYVVPRAAGAVDAAALRTALKEDLPDYMVPAHVVAMDGLPADPQRQGRPQGPPGAGRGRRAAGRPAARGGAGDRRRSRATGDERERRRGRKDLRRPAGGLQETIVRVWQGVLNVPQVGVDDNFFDLGGHSLLMVQVQQQLKSPWGATCPSPTCSASPRPLA